MGAVDIDPELKGWVLDFIRERGRVTIEDVRREFFPDEMGVPYLYLDRLTAEGRAIPVSEDLEPTRWSPVLITDSKETPRERRPAKRRRPKNSTARGRAQALADGEVHEMTTEEIRERFGFEEFRQFRNFLRGYARRHVDTQLSIQRTETGVKFCMGPFPLKWEAPRNGGRPPNLGAHRDCTHPKTPAAREKCREGRWGNVSLSCLAETPHATCTHPDTKYARKQCRKSRGHVSPSQTPKPKLTPEEAKATRKRWNGGAALTIPVLSRHIYRKMRANRDRQYMFTREWIGRQYPGVSPQGVDAALQHLVDTARISALPK